MMILDTNVLSAMMQASPEPLVLSWLNKQPPDSIWTTSVTVFEVRAGLLSMTKGRKQKALQLAFEQALELDLGGRVLDFNAAAAEEAALICLNRRQQGRAIEIRDAQIAGIALSRHATLATRNVKHFATTGVHIANPWDL